MKITYLCHDCFLIETASCNILTDYFNGVTEDPRMLLDTEKPTYMLVSHHHKDHFSPRIFSWWRQIPDLRYIVSRDVASMIAYLMNPDSNYKGRNKVDSDRVTVLGLHDEAFYPAFRVEAFGSTDIGNSYVINTEGKRIFFAGDLNAWTWREESTADEVAQALREYSGILKDIHRRYQSFDVALFPVDPRMGEDALEGGKIFCEMFAVRCFIPMHFELWGMNGKREDYVAFVKDAGKKIAVETGCCYVPLLESGENIEV